MAQLIPILYQDDFLLVVSKPADLLSVPGRPHLPFLAQCLPAALGDVFIVHRLDHATSGLMVLARDEKTHGRLSAAFRSRDVAKRYTAVCAGELVEDEGELTYPLSPDFCDKPRQQVDWFYGKPAHTRWQVLARETDQTRVALYPITGRTHQLRVHMSAFGHALLGDNLYASDADCARSPRLLLHAEHLRFVHPVTEEEMSFEHAAPF